MKKSFLIITAILFFSSVFTGNILAQVNVPDVNFRTALNVQYGISFDINNNITNPSTAAALTNLSIVGKNIASLDGIEAFTGLIELNCTYNQITSLNPSANLRLEKLTCINNPITTLNVLANTKLQVLSCDANRLTSLDVSANIELISLTCSGNQLANLNVSANPALQYLYCQNNHLTNLDITANIHLKRLWCNINQLTSLEVSANSQLEWLECSQNQITGLDVSANLVLQFLYCHSNQLTYLHISPNIVLEKVFCFDNWLSTLDVSSNKVLQILLCDDNRLTDLKVSGATALETLDCSHNQLTALDISSNIALQSLNCAYNRLTALNISSSNALLNGLYCDNNKLISLNVSANPSLQYLTCNDNQLTSLNVSANIYLGLLSCVNNHIPIILKGNSSPQIFKDEFSQVATFRGSTQNANVQANQIGAFILGSTGATLNITSNTGNGSSITAITGTSPGNSGILPGGVEHISEDKFWTIISSTQSLTYNLILDLTPISGISNFNSIRVLKRTNASKAWQDVSTISGVTMQYMKPFILVNGLTSFSDFAIAGAGDNQLSGPVIPEKFNLHQNYPNPFNSSTVIWYELPEDAKVTLEIFNLLGQEVRTLISSEAQTAGIKDCKWDGRDMHGHEISSGIYLYRLRAGKSVKTRKMVFVK